MYLVMPLREPWMRAVLRFYIYHMGIFSKYSHRAICCQQSEGRVVNLGYGIHIENRT